MLKGRPMTSFWLLFTFWISATPRHLLSIILERAQSKKIGLLPKFDHFDSCFDSSANSWRKNWLCHVGNASSGRNAGDGPQLGHPSTSLPGLQPISRPCSFANDVLPRPTFCQFRTRDPAVIAGFLPSEAFTDRHDSEPFSAAAADDGTATATTATSPAAAATTPNWAHVQ